EHRPLIVAVTGKHGETGGLPVRQNLVVGGRGVVRQRKIDVLVRVLALIEQRLEHLKNVVGIPSKGYFLAMRLGGDLSECLAADKVVVELDERSVSQLVGRHVVVFDVVGYEAAADGPG